MKRTMSQKDAENKINTFFEKKEFSRKEMRKIRRLAMKYKIPLKEKRKYFCKKCLSQLKGKIRVSKDYKTTECENCGYKNKNKIKK
jgi:RNase P subunit RPR2